MQFNIQEFSGMERFFFIELSYFDFSGLDLKNISFSNPIPLSEMIAVLNQAENSARILIPEYKIYRERAVERLSLMFSQSSLLKNMKLVGYMNDNGNQYGTTENFWKSGLVAQAYSDGDGNLMITYRGQEASSIPSAFHDFFSQAETYLGMIPAQFKKAHCFFRRIAAKAERNIILAGDRLGGAIAMYTYIMEKEHFQNLSGIAVNAKKGAIVWKRLKAERYLGTEDFVFKRNVKKEVHQDMAEVIFRDMEFQRKQENGSFYQEVSRCFEQIQMGHSDYYDVLEPLMQKLKDCIQADTLILWFRHADKNGEYIVPYIIQGKAMPGLQHLRLREGETAICASAFMGIGKLFPDIREVGMVSFMQPDEEEESMICVPILCEGRSIGVVSVSRSGRHCRFNETVYQQMMFFGEELADYLKPFQKEIYYDNDDYFLQIYDRTIQKPVFSIAEGENRTMAFSRKRACEGVTGRLTGKNLAPGEVWKYHRKYFMAGDAEELQSLVKGTIGILFAEEYAPENRLYVLLQPFMQKKEDKEYVKKLNQILKFEQFGERPFGTLSVKEKLIVHTCMALVKRPEFIIVYPYPYLIDERMREWADSMLRFLTAEERKTVLRFIIEP